MRYLMICMQFPMEPGQSYMTTELADALVAEGHEVEVLFLDWSAREGGATSIVVRDNGVRVVRCAPRAIGRAGSLAWKASKFLLTGRHVADIARRHFDLPRFDAALAWMPALAIAPLVPLLARAGIAHRILFIWDFFPDHHREIGRIPSGLSYRVARAWERRLVRQFTAIVCTLPGNADYLRRHYPLRPSQRVLVTPIWSRTDPVQVGDRSAIRASHGLPQDRPIAVFGGQLVEGRGFELMLAAADAGAAAKSSLAYLFVGAGRLADAITARVQGQGNVFHLEPLPRDDYLRLLGACDVGMAATVPGVTSFSIPTKIIDYLRAGLPVVAALEPGNEVAEIIARYGVGASVGFGSPAQFHQAAERLVTDPAAQRAARAGARPCLDEVFDIRHAVATLDDAMRA